MGNTYSQLSRGSTGSDVKKLQTYLNQVGNYGLDVDGKYGPATQAAVKKYQSSNNLTVDGIAGNQTWGSLSDAVAKLSAGSSNKGNTGATMESATPETPAAPDYSQYSYDASSDAAYQQALAALQQASATKPTYKASFDQQLQEVYDMIVNREKFTYDMNSDAMYQQYADQYQLMGQQAMMDTMGQAAALTGGYGNSYASTAGNQAYQAYLQQLNDVVPELYGMALDQYNAEGDRLLTQYAMLGDMADDEYSKYMDSYNQWWQDTTYKQQQADTAYNRGYENWLNSYQMGTDAENTAYTKKQTEREYLVNLITNTGYTPTASELAAAGMTNEQAAAYAQYYNDQKAASTKKSSGSGSGSGSGGGGGGTVNNGSVGNDNIAKMQAALGVDADGKWGPKSQAAAKAKWGTTSADEAWKAYQAGGGPEPDPTGFTGSTYEEAVAFAKANGVPGSQASFLTKGEWARVKSGGGTRDHANEFDTYAEYLQWAVESIIEEYGN